jgi:hypothetical protein
MHDHERRRRKRDKAQRRARLEAGRHYIQGPGLPGQVHTRAGPAGDLPVIDLSPGAQAGLPAGAVHHMVGCVLLPRLEARGDQRKRHRQLVRCGRVDTESELSACEGFSGPPCLLSLWWCPGCQATGLWACTLDELGETNPLWRADLRVFLKAEAARLQATDGILKGLYQEALAAGRSRLSTELAGLGAFVDLSPGVLARVPGRQLDHLVIAWAEPKLRDKRAAQRRRPQHAHGDDTTDATVRLPELVRGSTVPRYLVAVSYSPAHDNACLAACLVGKPLDHGGSDGQAT